MAQERQDENAPGRVAVRAARTYYAQAGDPLPRQFRVRRHNLVHWSQLQPDAVPVPPLWSEEWFNTPYAADLAYDRQNKTFAPITRESEATTAAPVGVP
jgi:hypothetical protein